ncbi:sensor histidine kinase [Winogradskyella ouciana]|uniref:sensor histidine kinase n=1 Tax=Winogradskyella ouciana TaxID=2608631 RepID=UPI00138FEB41|nr:sensor histidine kinase [Winogradskyella ouciana]
MSDTRDNITHTYEITLELERMLAQVYYAKANHRGFIISQDSVFLHPFITNKVKIVGHLYNLEVLTKSNDVQHKNLDTLSTDVRSLISYLDQTISYNQSQLREPDTLKNVFINSRYKEDLIRTRTTNMVDLENDVLEIRQSENSQVLNYTPIILYSVLILTLILLMLAYARITHDINYLKRINRTLDLYKNSSQQAEIIGQNGTWIWNIDDNTFEFSDNFYRLMGVHPKNINDGLDTFLSNVHKNDRAQLKRHIIKMKTEEHPPFMNYRIIDPNYNVKHFKVYGQLVETKDGQKQIIGTTADITADVENLYTIENRNRELEHNNKELSTFNYVASHDLQEPLRKIQTFLSRLEIEDKHSLSQKGLHYIERVKSSAARMRMLIDDLLQYSRTNKSDKKFIDTDINNIINDVLEELSPSIKSTGAIINVDEFPKMKVTPFQMHQLFVNIINNAIKYRKENVTPKVNITYNEVKSNTVKPLQQSLFKYFHNISITDNGIGFDEAHADKIFILFKRLHKEKYDGTGIGLSICKKIVDNHNGYILASGEPNVGAKFDIYIPFLR